MLNECIPGRVPNMPRRSTWPHHAGAHIDTHGVWRVLGGATKPFVLCRPGAGGSITPVGMLGMHVLFHMSSVKFGQYSRQRTDMLPPHGGCAARSHVGELAIAEAWPLASPEMIEQARQGDVWYNKATDDFNLVGEFG